MPILPVWLREWELGGGDYSARVAEPWDGTLVMHDIQDWSQVSSGELGWEEVDAAGKIHFVAEAVPHPTHGELGPVLEFGGCRICSIALETLGLIEGEGTVAAGSSAYFDPEVTTRGIVRRLAIRPRILERVDERTFTVTGHGPPADVEALSYAEFRGTEFDVVMRLDIVAADEA